MGVKPVMTKLGRLVLAGVLVLMAMMGSTAYAVPGIPGADDNGGETAAVSTCGTSATDRSSDYLPVNRWAESTTFFHSRLDADTWNDMAEKVDRNGRDATFMQIGNASWRLSTDALYASSTFCPIDVLGYPLDNLVGTIGKALTSTGLLAGLAVVTLGAALLAMRRGRDLAYVLKEAFKTGAILGLLTAMILGGAASTQDKPGAGSPWWWVTQANTVVNTVSGAIASTAVKSSENLMGYQNLSSDAGTAEDWPITCTTTGDATGYVDYLHKSYNESYTQDGSANARAAGLPEMVSTIWEAEVLPVYASAQFGSSNPYTDHVYCFFLEAKSHSVVSSNSQMTSYLTDRLGASADESWAWGDATNSMISSGGNAEDQSLLGWAACTPADVSSATVRGDWANVSKAPSETDCTTWWAGGGPLDGTSLDWDEKSVGDNAKGSEAVYNYVASVHGKGGTRVGSILFAYLVGSLVDGAILVLLSLLQLGSKLVVAFMVAGLFAALARALVPGDDWRLFKRTGLQLIGASFVSSCAGLMIAIIMMVAGAVTKVGAETFSPGTTGAVLATCLGPVVGVFLLHWLFTSVLHVPSPFTLKGAMAWGRGITSGVVGGGALAGVAGLASNARETARGALGRPGVRPRPGDGRRRPGEIDRNKVSKGEGRHVFTHRSATEQLRASKRNKRNKEQEDSPSVLEQARAERDERRKKVKKEAERLATNDGHLGSDDAWKGYTRKARANLAKARASEIKDAFTSAAASVPGRVRAGVSGLGARGVQGARHAATSLRAGVVEGADAAHALAGWAAHHPARAAAAVGTAGWRTAATGARAAASGASALRHMPAKKAVAAGAGAALAVGAAPVAAGIVATATGAGWARARSARAPETASPRRVHVPPAAPAPATPAEPSSVQVPVSAPAPASPEVVPVPMPAPEGPAQQPVEPEPQHSALERARGSVTAVQAQSAEQARQRADDYARAALERVRNASLAHRPPQ